MRHLQMNSRFFLRRVQTVFFIVCIFLVFGISWACADDTWCSVFEETAGLPVDQNTDITVPPLGNKEHQTIELLRIPAAEAYQAKPGTCLRNIKVQCGENSYRLIVSKPHLPAAYQELVETSNVSYLMVTNHSEIGLYAWDIPSADWDESYGRFSYISNTDYPDERWPAFVDLVAFDPNQDFVIKAQLTLGFQKEEVKIISYRYKPESIWGIRIGNHGYRNENTKIYCETNQIWNIIPYEDESIHASLDKLDIPDYLLNYFWATNLRNGSSSVRDYHPYTGRKKETGKPPTASFTIPDAYRDFLFNGAYRHAGQQFYDENEVNLTMWDLDEDGSAELLMYNGGEEGYTSALYVYTVKNGSVRFAGDVRCLYPGEGISASADIKGLALYDYDPETEQDISLMLTLENGTLQTKDLSIEYVFGSYLHWYKLQSLPALGWEAFRSAPFILNILDVDVNFTPKEYIANHPLKASLTIKNGTPPYNISYWYETINEGEEESTVVSEGQFQSSDAHPSFTFVPESGKDLWFNLYVTDLYGTNTGLQDPYALELTEAWSQARLFTLMSKVFESVKDPSQTEGVAYYEGLGDNANWFARFLESLTDIANPAKALKKAIETATGEDLKKYLIKSALTMTASKDTFKLPKLNHLPATISDFVHADKFVESRYIDDCAKWLADNSTVNTTVKISKENLADIFKATKKAGIGEVRNALSEVGFSGEQLDMGTRYMKGLQTLGTVIKIADKGVKNYNRIQEVYNQMAMAETLDSKQLGIIADIYTSQGYPIGKELKQLAGTSAEERAALIWRNNAAYLSSDFLADAEDTAFQFGDESGVLAVLDVTTWIFDKMVGSNSISGQVYILSQASEMTRVFWRNYKEKHNSFLANPTQPNFESTCYAMINYYKAAAIAEEAFVKLVQKGQKTFTSSLIGFGEPMIVASERAEKNAETMNTIAENMRLIHDLWQENISHPNESIETIIRNLNFPEPYSSGNSSNTDGAEYGGYSGESIRRGTGSTVLSDPGDLNSSGETIPETDEQHAESTPEEETSAEDYPAEEQLHTEILPEEDESTINEPYTENIPDEGHPAEDESYAESTPDENNPAEDTPAKESADTREEESKQAYEPVIGACSGTGFTNKNRVNVRSEPDQVSEIVTQWTKTWSPVTVTGYTTDQSGTGWYRVILPNRKTGFIREDLLDIESINTAAWTCKNCGQTGNTENFCSHCGNPAPAKEEPKAKDTETWTCENCGQTGNTENFCPHCGKTAPYKEKGNTAPWTCENCSQSGNTENFCPHCGNPAPYKQ